MIKQGIGSTRNFCRETAEEPRMSRSVAFVATFVLLLSFAWAPASASALTYEDLLKSFGPEGSEAGKLEIPLGPATDPVTGHILIAGPEINSRIDEFSPWGEFVRAFGWDVAPGAVNEQQEIRVRAAEGQFELSFESDTTGDLPFDASAAEVESALNALPSIGGSGGTVSVTDHPGLVSTDTPWVYVVAFKGALAGTDVPELTIQQGSEPLGGGAPVTSFEVSTRANGTSGGAGLETCTAESGCKAGVAGPAPGQLNRPADIAVAKDGRIYVRESSNKRVQVFSAAGEFDFMFGAEVNKTAVQDREEQEANVEPVTVTPEEENICTAISGDVCGEGVVGTGPGEFSGGGDLEFAPSGDLWVADVERIQKFSPEGEYLTEVSVGGVVVAGLAVDPFTENLYATYRNLSFVLQPDVHKLDSVTGAELGVLSVGQPIAVATDADGNVFVDDGRVEGGVSPHPERIFEYDSSGSLVSTIELPESALPVRGLAANGIGDLVVPAGRDNSGTIVQIFGPPPVIFESAPKAPPAIEAQFASKVLAEEAQVRAEINPEFWADTRYYVEYGTSPCWEGGCSPLPAPPGTLLTSEVVSRSLLAGPVALTGLQPGTKYFYRFVAQSSGGGPVFGLTGKSGAESENSFTTRRTGAVGPDQRAYELVSPTQKNGAEVGAPINAAGGSTIKQAAPSGEEMTYTSFTAFADAESAPTNSQYVSRRTSTGWTTENISPFGFLDLYSAGPYQGFTQDLKIAGVVSFEPPLTSDAQEGFSTLYRRDNGTGQLTATNTEEPKLASGETFCIIYGGATEDGSKVLFGTNGSFVGAPKAKGVNLYEWTAAGGVKLVSVLPGGAAATPQRNTGFGAGGGGIGGPSGCQMNKTNLHSAMSSDGQRIFWTYETATETKLLARVNGTETVQLDAAEGGAGPSGGGEYLEASTDGSRVLFMDANQLTADASGGRDLYLYDFDAPPGARLTNLTPDEATPGSAAAGVLGLLGAGEDADYAYFAASTALAPGAEAAGCGVGAGACIYRWHEGEGLTFIAKLLEDKQNWSDSVAEHTSHVTPSGLQLAFVSTTRLSEYDNRPQSGAADSGCPPAADEIRRCGEVYLYDAAGDDLVCASCNPTGARPTGPSSLPTWFSRFEAPRYLSDDGSRLFFQTSDAIDPSDENGLQDVYEFERAGVGTCTEASPAFNSEQNGCVFMVSGGGSDDLTYLLDASADGRDVFFATREQLLPRDRDERFDIYDFRSGGGFPEPSAPPSCEGEGCRPSAQAPPSVTGVSTPGVTGSGNVVRKPCPKGKVRRKGRCVKPHKKHRGKHHHKRASGSQKRGAAR
jgi:hypothetical protein